MEKKEMKSLTIGDNTYEITDESARKDIEVLKTENIDRQSEIAVERARINQFVSLPNGSTTGDAELIDARVGVNGKVHENVGEHIREIGKLSRNLAGVEETVAIRQGVLSDTPKVYKYASRVHLIGKSKYLDRIIIPVHSLVENNEILIELYNSTEMRNALISHSAILESTEETKLEVGVGIWFHPDEPIIIQVKTCNGEDTLYYSYTTKGFDVEWIAHDAGLFNNSPLDVENIQYMGELIFLSELNEEVAEMKANIEKAENNKLDKIYSNNRLDPSKFRVGYFAFTSQVKVDNYGNGDYGTTDYIPVSEKGLITNGSGENGVTSQVIYDEELLPLRYVNQNDQYTFVEGDAYVVFCYYIANKKIEEIAVVEGTEYYFEKYSDYVPLTELQEEVDSLQEEVDSLQEEVDVLKEEVDVLKPSPKTQLSLISTSPIYSVLNDYNKNRNYASALWIDHLISNVDWKDKDIGFGERREKFYHIYPPILADMEENISENALSPVIVSSEFEVERPSIVHRSSKASASSDEFPKVLVIGDSVTDGYLAGYNKENEDLPNQYWSWVRYYFENDKLECGIDGTNNCLMVGIPWFDNIWYGTHSAFRLNGEHYDNYAVGKGGWSAEDLNLATFESDTNINPFYDTTTGKFSLKVALDKFKTLADDGVTRLVVGETAGTEVTDANAYDFCTPTHVVINLNHNSSLEEYQANIPGIVNTIKREYPNMVVILMMIDQVGTYFPSEYPNYDSSIISFGGAYLHNKNVSIYNYIKEHLEDEANGVYVCSGNLIQPTVDSYPSIEHLLPEFAGDSSKIYHGKSDGGGAEYHPNNHAHSAWGYQLYALIKWTLANK